MNQIIKAIVFAAEKHKAQHLKDNYNTPYINHLIGVCYILYSDGRIDNNDVLIAGLLHDILEDTNTTEKEIDIEFSEKIRKIIQEVTDNKNLDKITRKKIQLENGFSLSDEAKLVKLADKIYNIRNLILSPPNSWSLIEIQGYFVWCYKLWKKLQGINIYLDSHIEKLFNSHFLYKNCQYPVIPDCNLDLFLENYYKNIYFTE